MSEVDSTRCYMHGSVIAWGSWHATWIVLIRQGIRQGCRQGIFIMTCYSMYTVTICSELEAILALSSQYGCELYIIIHNCHG